MYLSQYYSWQNLERALIRLLYELISSQCDNKNLSPLSISSFRLHLSFLLLMSCTLLSFIYTYVLSLCSYILIVLHSLPQHLPSHLVIRCGNHAGQAESEIQRSNVGQASRVVQKGGVWSDVANVGSEGAKVAVALQRAEAVQVGCALVEELLRGGEVLVGVGVFGDPDFLAGESVVR
jgi:hypothetical protein